MHINLPLFCDENLVPWTPDTSPLWLTKSAVSTPTPTPPASPRKKVQVRATQLHTYSTFKLQIDGLLQKINDGAIRQQIHCIVEDLELRAFFSGDFYSELFNRIENALRLPTEKKQLAELGLIYFYLNKEGRVPAAESLLEYRVHQLNELVTQKEMALEKQPDLERLITPFFISLLVEMAIRKEGKIHRGGLQAVIECLHRTQSTLFLKYEHVEQMQNVCQRLAPHVENLIPEKLSEIGKTVIALELRKKREEINLQHVMQAILTTLFSEILQTEENCYAVASYSWSLQTFPDKIVHYYFKLLQQEHFTLPNGVIIPADELFRHRFVNLEKIQNGPDLLSIFFDQSGEPQSKKRKAEGGLSEEAHIQCVSLYQSALQSYLLSSIQFLATNDREFLKKWVKAYTKSIQASVGVSPSKKTLLSEVEKVLFLENLSDTKLLSDLHFTSTHLNQQGLQEVVKRNSRNGLVHFEKREWKYITSFEQLTTVTEELFRKVDAQGSSLLKLHDSQDLDRRLAKLLFKWNKETFKVFQEEDYLELKLLLIAQNGGRSIPALGEMGFSEQDYEVVFWEALDAKQMALECFKIFSLYSPNQDLPLLIEGEEHAYQLFPHKSRSFYGADESPEERLNQLVFAPAERLKEKELCQETICLILSESSLSRFAKILEQKETVKTFIQKVSKKIKKQERASFFSKVHEVLYSVSLSDFDLQEFVNEIFESPKGKLEQIQETFDTELMKALGISEKYPIPHFARLLQRAIFSSGYGLIPTPLLEEALYVQLDLPVCITLGDLNGDDPMHRDLFGVTFSFETNQLEYCYLDGFLWGFEHDCALGKNDSSKVFVPKLN